MGTVLENVLVSVPAWTVYLLVFVLPFVECSLFVGFVFPGETALLLGGVLASGALPGSAGRVNLVVLCVLATLGAVLGDSAGYAVGRRYGPAIERSRLGRYVGDRRWRSAEAFLVRRGGPAVFLGRFTAVLRALVPSAAGMSHLPFRTFLLWNAAGGVIWANLCVLGGYLAGASYHQLESYLGAGALVLTGLVLAALVVVHVVRSRRGRGSLVEQALGLPGDDPQPDGDTRPGGDTQPGDDPQPRDGDPATSVPTGR